MCYSVENKKNHAKTSEKLLSRVQIQKITALYRLIHHSINRGNIIKFLNLSNGKFFSMVEVFVEFGFQYSRFL